MSLPSAKSRRCANEGSSAAGHCRKSRLDWLSCKAGGGPRSGQDTAASMLTGLIVGGTAERMGSGTVRYAGCAEVGAGPDGTRRRESAQLPLLLPTFPNVVQIQEVACVCVCFQAHAFTRANTATTAPIPTHWNQRVQMRCSSSRSCPNAVRKWRGDEGGGGRTLHLSICHRSNTDCHTTKRNTPSQSIKTASRSIKTTSIKPGRQHLLRHLTQFIKNLITADLADGRERSEGAQ